MAVKISSNECGLLLERPLEVERRERSRRVQFRVGNSKSVAIRTIFVSCDLLAWFCRLKSLQYAFLSSFYQFLILVWLAWLCLRYSGSHDGIQTEWQQAIKTAALTRSLPPTGTYEHIKSYCIIKFPFGGLC